MRRVLVSAAVMAALLLSIWSLPVQAQGQHGGMGSFTDLRGHWAEAFIRTMLYAGVLDVPEDSLFRPDEPVTRASFTFWLARSLELAALDEAGATDFTPPFTDWEQIPVAQRGHIAAAHAADLIQGYPNGTFDPGGTITRLEIATIMGRSLIDLGLAPQNRFFDQFVDGKTIPAWGLPAALAVEKLIIIGVPKGGNMYFDPTATTTRGQAVTMTARFTEIGLAITGLPKPTPRPVSPPRTGSIVAGYYINQDVAYKVLEEQGAALDWLVYWSYVLGADGKLMGTDSPRTLGWAADNGRPLIALLANHDREATSRLLNNTAAWDQAARDLKALMAKGYSGVNFDFEDVPLADGPALTQFICTMYGELKAGGHHVSLSLPAKTSDAGNGWSGPFDYGALGSCADYVVIMTYDFSWPAGPPGPVGPIGWMKRVMEYAATRIPPAKLLLGIPAYGYEWPTAGGTGRALTARQIEDLSQRHRATVTYSADDGESTFTYWDETGVERRVWYTPAAGLAAKLNLVNELNLSGTAMWRVGQEVDSYWPHLQLVGGR